MVNELSLRGCTAVSLGGYLQALGVLRVVASQADPSARLQWNGDLPLLTTVLTAERIVDWLVQEYAPTPIVSPWNSGSGFAGNGKSAAAEKAVQAFRTNAEPRFAELRATIRAADQVVAHARERGFEGGSLWATDRKADIVRMCRNTFPDKALAWVDTAVVLTTGDVQFNPLTGTGGNFGRQDLSATFLQRLAMVAGPSAAPKSSAAFAEAALFGREDVPYLRDTVGQFDPGRAGGVLSTPGEKNDDTGFANPWSQILTLEGTLLFASAVTRRNRASTSAGALPFAARTSAVGYSTASGEEVKGEQWVPFWERPAGLGEIEYLIGEGRVQWNGRPARDGLEFALAIASLGTDRGLSAFRRFVIASRFGQNPLAVPAGRFTVRDDPAIARLREPYEWLRLLHRLALPAGVASLARRTDAAICDIAAGHGTEALRRFLILFGQLHNAVARSGTVRDQIAPYRPRDRVDWLMALPDDPELWIAAGIASLHDPVPKRSGEVPGATSDRSARALLTRVQRQTGSDHQTRTVWTDRPLTRVDLSDGTLIQALLQAHRIRMTFAGDPDRADGPESSAMARREPGGPFSSGQPVPLDLVEAFMLGQLDDQRIADYLNGLLALGCPDRTHAQAPQSRNRPLHPALAALVSFFSGNATPHERAVSPSQPHPVAAPTVSEADRPGDGNQHADGGPADHTLDVRPKDSTDAAPRARPEWISKLGAYGLGPIASDVLLRLRLNGFLPVLRRTDLAAADDPTSPMRIDSARLAAALLLRISPADRSRALRTVCVVPTQRPSRQGA
ncbi:type I-U CRISPR-associated protein Csx17 [Actinomadura rayongensis]|uniref:Type I-U CRISPR-associated protein Csx17 n=1 Tax=Actinomadura rayongensis TaxID=1429076 RepID=A0A6I4WA40_9ACTN|nr:type I-U CRISPR-associated protein Csx17 [Actinomadura rayongensis]MXQ64926.1 type I-U CRISPR-associated protein Csx17 [Actinomadura rayongensis]